MITHRGLRSALLIVASLGLALAPAAAGATKVPWSGNAAAVAFYRTAVATTNALPVIQDVQLGYYWLWDDAYISGSTGPFELNWGYATKPSANMVRAQATFLISMTGGKQSWYTVTFAAGPAIDPLELYVTPSGDYWGYLTKGSSQVGCWSHATGTTAWIAKDFTVGAQWRTYGRFSPLVTRGSRVLVTSTYTNVDGAKVTETDSINATSKLFTGSVIHVSRSTKPVYAAHSYSLVETDPTTAPVAPSVTLCG
ncbi:MAG TPA: hypothetical protein VGZ68_07960 [Acidimicrobiales bacterium]|jgi:hypothetical protein|nr:hypothetical protein [Acidimicrobiales bacterium]